MLNKPPLFTRRRYYLAALIVLLAILDPFGLASSSDKASAQWFNRMLSGGYPNTGQQQVAVVLVDDAYLMRNNTSWPMPYDEQSKLFKRLLAYKPKAVFVDLLYSHDHSLGDPARGSQLLANVFERYQRQGIALFVANTGVTRGEDGQANTLAPFTGISQPALVLWDGVDDRYPLALKTSQGVLETPAMALYREYCKTQTCQRLPENAQATVASAPLVVQWGLKLAPQQARIKDLSDCASPSHFLPDWLRQLAQAVFWRFDDSAQARCAYSLTLSASDLEVSAPEDQALIAQLLGDRLVMVGAKITSTGDLVQSPVHGLIPGVYLHAMALDNLMTKGMDYDREPGSLPLFNISWLDVLELGLLALIALFKALHARQLAKQPAWTRWPSWERRLFSSPYPAWGLVLMVLAAVCIVLRNNHYTAVNVLGITLLSLVLLSDRFEAFFDRGR
ncbi:CHASE2 domain-containing protein [Pseudomonas sp. CCM 7891]|uniref:CHASE2 domain-containing protein n=1 Tax=Pseudomonas karstica TaxID=1055468 RepID=A0A7X2RU76_9PSED|nr:CHASE2 domain-containing protein [Pseudomonas karstica]MTD21182.1 CHASE2 domain-containing protein [Pseudomonas karstica]